LEKLLKVLLKKFGTRREMLITDHAIKWTTLVIK
jgi:hypothetical protein